MDEPVMSMEQLLYEDQDSHQEELMEMENMQAGMLNSMEVRKKNEEIALTKSVANLQKYTNFSKEHAKNMFKEYVDLNNMRKKVFENKDQIIVKLLQDKEELKKKFLEFQTASTQHIGVGAIEEGNDESRLLMERPQSSSSQLVQPPNNEEYENWQQFRHEMKSIGIRTVSDMQQILLEKAEAEEKMKDNESEIAKMSNEMQKITQLLQDAEIRCRRAERALWEERQNSKLLQLQMDAVKEKLEKVEREATWRVCDKVSNNMTRAGEQNLIDLDFDDMNNTLQIEARDSMQMRFNPVIRQFSRQGKEKSEETERRETARFYNRSTEEIVGTDEAESLVMRNMGNVQRSRGYQEQRVEQGNLNQLFFLQQMSVPDPPKFSAEPNSLNIKSFQAAFEMKFQHMNPKQQVLLLETNFLIGKALRIFRGIPETEKYSLSSTLNAISKRMSISKEDEEKQALEKFQNSCMDESQSFEDFCLRIEALAAKAYRNGDESLVSRIKCTKLIGEIRKRNPVLACMVESKCEEVPKAEQYETARRFAMKLESGFRGEKKEMNKPKGVENDWRSQNRFNNSGGSQKSGQTPINNTNGVQGNHFNAAPKIQPKHFDSTTPLKEQKEVPHNSRGENANMQNWRNPNNNWMNRSSFSCPECNMSGFHDPLCSKAPGNRQSSNSANKCFRCGEVGHYANRCPQPPMATVQPGQAAMSQDQKIQVIETKAIVFDAQNTTITENEVNVVKGEEDRVRVKVEEGRIGKAEVDLVIDSGASLSLISKRSWDRIVAINGEAWEKKVVKQISDLDRVYAANNQPMHLLFKASIETAMQARTREIDYYIADVDRDTLILGIDQFGKMGISMSIEATPRDIKMSRDIKLIPGLKRYVEVSVEGIIREDECLCLVTPLHSSIAPAVCVVNRMGKAVIEVSNYGSENILLRKGQKVAVGEFEGFEVLQNEEELESLKKSLQDKQSEEKSEGNSCCNINWNPETEERWKIICEHLQKKQLSSKEEEKVWEVIKSFQHIFAIEDSELGKTNAVQCEIELQKGVEPIRQRPRPIPLAIRPEISKMLDKMLSQGVIRESKSPWASPVVLVKKKDGSVRMCVDFRKVNKVVKNNAHPLPHIEATLQSLSGKTVFTTLDLVAGYWQIPLEEESKEITAFAIGSRLFEFNVLPFGLVTSPAVFQNTMESVIGDLLGECAFVYVDDLLIASSSMEEHIRDIQKVLERVERSGLRFRASKCIIAQPEVEYLGHRVTPNGIQTQEAKVEKMQKFSRPTNAKELQSFLGLVGYYRKFVMNFAQMASALTPLTAKKTVWKWEAEQETAFQQLLTAVCTTPVLAQPDIEAAVDGSRPFLVYTDASRQGIGAVLAQVGKDEQQHPIAFTSKSLTPAETRYHVSDLEALAMVKALNRFKTIIYGAQVIVYTDHKPLMYLLKGSPLADRLLRWSFDIADFNVKIVYVKGKANSVADALSRGGCPPIEIDSAEDTELKNIIAEISQKEEEDLLDTTQWFKWLKEEDGWKEMIDALEKKEKSRKVHIPGVKGESSVDSYMLIGKSLRNIEKEEGSRLVVPLVAISKLIQEAHEGETAGHFGTDKMMRQLSKRFFFAKMRALIEAHVKSCAKCLCTNDHPKLVAPLTPYEVSEPLEIVACDLIDVGLSTQGNRYILMMIDLFTKYGSAVAIPDKRAETVLKAFAERWAIGESRIPEKLLTDQGKEFDNDHFHQFTKLMKIEHLMTKGYNSRANGAIERFNKTLMHIMKKKNKIAVEWDDQVAYAVHAYNCVAHNATGESPNFLMYGRDSKGPLEKMGGDAGGMKYADMDEYKNLLVHELGKVYEFVREHARVENEENKRLFDEKYKTDVRTYPQLGSRVLVEVPSEKMDAKCPKLVNKWKGMYRVISCSQNSATVVPIGGNKKDMLVVPFDNLRKVPVHMQDTEIKTQKGRAKGRSTQMGDFQCSAITMTPTNSSSFSDMFNCRCDKPCAFILFNIQESKNKEIARTPSPTQFVRMCFLLRWNAELAQDVPLLFFMSQRAFPFGDPTPDLDVFKHMSHCATLNIVVDDVLGWRVAYDMIYDDTLKRNLKPEIRNPCHSLLVIMSGVPREAVPLVQHHKLRLESRTSGPVKVAEYLLQQRIDIVFLVVPFSGKEEVTETIEKIMSMIPDKIQVVLLPAPMKLEDYSLISTFSLNLNRAKRDHGAHQLIDPDSHVRTHQNKVLAAIGDEAVRSSTITKIHDYWTIVKRMLEEEQVSWQQFQLEKEKDRRSQEKQVKGTGGSRLKRPYTE